MEKEKIKFLRVRTVKSPQRAYKFDAGIDFFVPEFNDDFIKDLINKNLKTFNLSEYSAINKFPHHFFNAVSEKEKSYFILKPGHGIMIPSGIKCRMAKPGRALIAANKSGIATKHKLTFGAQVVDYTYKGEIHLHLINNSNDSVKIYSGQKILQFLETPIYNSEVELSVGISEDEFYKGLENDRGSGGFGSTDKK